jgi:hypothetical protein
MLRLYDFKCLNGHVFEALVPVDQHTVRCECGDSAKRIISPVRSKLDPISGDFPDATRRWAKARASHIQYEKKQSS